MQSNITLRQRLFPMGLPGPAPGTSLRHFANMPEVLTRVQLDTTVEGGDNASLAVGIPIFSPGVNSVVLEAEMNVTLKHLDVAAQDETPDVGLGSVIATGAVSTLGGTAAFEDILTGQTSPAINGTSPIRAANRNVLKYLTADGVFLNIAALWNNVTDTTIAVTGTVWIRWRHAQFT